MNVNGRNCLPRCRWVYGTDSPLLSHSCFYSTLSPSACQDKILKMCDLRKKIFDFLRRSSPPRRAGYPYIICIEISVVPHVSRLSQPGAARCARLPLDIMKAPHSLVQVSHTCLRNGVLFKSSGQFAGIRQRISRSSASCCTP